MGFFNSFTNPNDFYIEGITEGGPTAPKSNPVHNDPDIDLRNSNKDTKAEEKAGDTVTNNYDPSSKKMSEATLTNSHIREMTQSALYEYMEMGDIATVKYVCSLNEAEQNSLLLNLSNKLYKMIVEKVDSIDYGEIPDTKGDVTKLSKYDKLRECHEILRGIFHQYKESEEPINTITNALDNIENMKDIFVGAFMARAEFPKSVYNSTVLGVIMATSFMIATCIEYIKSPKKEGLEIVLNKTGIAKVKEHLVYENLKNFNDACRKGDVENALRPFVQNKTRGFVMTAALGLKAVLVIGGVVIAILPILKDLVYFYYSSKARVSQYFDLQAKLIEMNAAELKDNTHITTQDDKAAVIRRQLAIADTFHKISNFLTVDAKGSEVEATKEIKRDQQKYKIDDVEPGATGDNGPLF